LIFPIWDLSSNNPNGLINEFKKNTNMKRIALIFGAALCFMASSCDGSKSSTTPSTPTTVNVTSVTLSSTTLSMVKDETKTLTATVSPSNATNKTVSWSSSNTSVATVSNGLVTAVAAGQATITATADGKSATCSVTVSNPEVKVQSVSLSESSVEIIKGESLTITATVSPSDATNPDVTWSTSDANVATVKDGVITAVGSGKTTITATADGVSSTCEVTVIEAYEGWWKVSSVTVNECSYQRAINNNKSILEKFNVLVKKVSDEEAYAYLFDESTSTFKTGFSGKIKSDTCVGDTREESSSRTILNKTVTTVNTFTFEFNVTDSNSGSLSCLYLNKVNDAESTLADVDFTCARASAPSGYTEGMEDSVSIVTGVPTVDDIKSLLGK